MGFIGLTMPLALLQLGLGFAICNFKLVCQISNFQHDYNICQESLASKWFLTGDLKEGIIANVIDHLHM